MNLSSLSNKITPNKTFIILSFIFGVLFSIIIPPFQAPDEPAHFYRAYQLSEFKIVGQKVENYAGGYIPKQIIEMTETLTGNIPGHKENKASIDKIGKYIKIKPNFEEIKLADFKNTVLYPPTVYLPQSLGITIAKVFKLSPLWMVYLGRILNLLTFILIVSSAIRIIPICKWGMVLLGLMPMTLAQASSLSLDATCFSMSFLLIALILNYALSEDKKITVKQVFIMSLVSFFLGLCKWAYIFIPFLFLIIPPEKFSSKKKYFISFFTVIFSTVIGILVWSLIIRNLYLPILDYLNPHEQLLYMLVHPQYFIKGFLGSFTNFFTFHSFIGNLGWVDNSLPTGIVIAYFGVLAACGLIDSNEKISINFPQRLVAAIVLFLSVLFVDIMMYLFWNRVGATFIEGLQGRYFIPVALLLFLFFYNKRFCKLNIMNKGGKIFLVLFLIFVLLFTLGMIVNRYYR